MDVHLSADQIQGGRDYQEDFFAVVEGDVVHYRGERYQLDSGISSEQVLFVLADGMGGMGHGDLAASLIVEHFIKHCLSQLSQQSNLEETFVSAAEEANRIIASKVAENPELQGMGATLLVLLWGSDSRQIKWLSIGDSLLYRISSNGNFSQLNEIHTWGQQAHRLSEEAQGLSERELEDREHALCSAVDGKNIKFIDINTDGIALDEGDCVIVASDGLETLSPTKIVDRLRESQSQSKQSDGDQPPNFADALLSQIQDAAEPYQDNTTILTLFIAVSEQADTQRTTTQKVVRHSAEQVQSIGVVDDRPTNDVSCYQEKGPPKSAFVIAAGCLLGGAYLGAGLLGYLPKNWVLW